MLTLREHLLIASWFLEAGDHEGGDHWYYEQALRNLRLALEAAKREGNGYAAGRILTALQFAKQCGVPRQDSWSVWCREDRKPNGEPGDMVRATRKRFASKEDALQYMQGISPSREPELRQDIVLRPDNG